MPPEGEPLSEEQIDAVRHWIRQGATSPVDEQPETDPADHWAFQPLVRPEIPTTDQADSDFSNPIDQFVAAKLQEHAIVARPTAAKHVRLRRIFLDLIGLPTNRPPNLQTSKQTNPTPLGRVWSIAC